jgi:hypothetical protein
MGGRAVECTGLENRQRRKAFVGSNPTPSASKIKDLLLKFFGQKRPLFFGLAHWRHIFQKQATKTHSTMLLLSL